MHIAQAKIGFEYFPVYQTLHENLFQAETKSKSEEASLQP
jgi:hypothetical protein